MSALLLVGLVLVVSACGGSSKKAASPTTAATTTAATTTAGATTTEAAKPATPTFKSAKNCQQLAQLVAQVAKSLQTSSGDVKTVVANEEKVLAAMAQAVPSEIRSDFQTFADAFKKYVETIQKLQIKPGTVPNAAQIAQLTEATKAFSTTKLQAAEQHLSAWAAKNCSGVKTP